MSNLKNKKLFLLDMDGTIYLDNDLFDGTIEFLEYVKAIGGRYIFMTNNSSYFQFCWETESKKKVQAVEIKKERDVYEKQNRIKYTTLQYVSR